MLVDNKFLLCLKKIRILYSWLDVIRGNAVKPRNNEFIQEQIEYDWTIETTAGEITFKSVGYTQFFRGDPILIKRQSLNLQERGGLSFASKNG